MSSKKQLEIRLKDCTEQRNLSVEQIQEYISHDHIIDTTKLTQVLQNIEQVDFNGLQQLRKVIDNSSNIVYELNLLVKKEFQRRGLVENLSTTTERGFVRKSQEPWYRDSPRSRSASI